MPPKKWMKPPPGHDLFLVPLQLSLSQSDYEKVEFAYQVSKYGHSGQLRDDGSRYFDHPKAVAWIYIKELGGRDPRVIIGTLLHDISEDAYLISSYRIKRNFGEGVALDVRAMTKVAKGKETTEEYLGRIIEQGPYAILDKLLDRLHNLRQLGSCTKAKRQKQITETRVWHLPFLIPPLQAHGKLWAWYAARLEKLILEAIDAYEVSAK